MKVTFSKSITGNEEYCLNLNEISKEELCISISRESFISSNESFLEQSYLIDKKELHELIGALLHIQTKMK